eukprot:3077006-Pyramimonas_sp.AAC.1
MQFREALLAGDSTVEELKRDDLGVEEKRNLDITTKTERSKWAECGAYRNLPAKGRKELMRRSPGIRAAGARW